MQCNGNFKQWFNIFLIISEVWQGYESKAYGVSNHNLKLQSKKLSRTRDIPNFPTQGWADTAFCTRNRSETYICKRCDDRHYVFTTEIRCGTGDNSRIRWTWCCSMRMTIRSGGTERARWVGSPGRCLHTIEVCPSSGTCSWKLLGKTNPTMWLGRSTFL